MEANFPMTSVSYRWVSLHASLPSSKRATLVLVEPGLSARTFMAARPSYFWKSDRVTAAAMERSFALAESARLVSTMGAAAPRISPAVSFFEK